MLDALGEAEVSGIVGVHERFVGPAMHPVGADATSSTFEYLVMDWIDGRTVAEAIRNGAPAHEVVAALTPVAEALDLLCSGALTGGRPVLHGDVKPDNIMIRSDGSAVLVDLGLLHGTDIVLAGAGSAGYRVPPEVCLAGQDDLYGFAGVVFHAFTGSHPPDDPSALMARMSSAGTPTAVRELIVAARRHGHHGGVVAWLSEVQRAMGPVRLGRRSPAMALAALTALLVLAGALALALTDAGAPTATTDLVCDSDRWAADAGRMQGDTPLTWKDTDGDCLHDAYEINAIGSDPARPVGSEAWLTPADAQLSYLVEVHQLLRSEVWLDPVACRPSVWADAASAWRRSHPDAPPWDDPDGDCLATVHEHLLGTDPMEADTDDDAVIDSLDPDSSNGLIEPFDIQLTPAGPVAAQPAGQPPRLDRPRADGPGD